MLDRLKCMCEDFLIRNIDQDNVFLILPIAKVYSQPLLSTCFSFIKKNFETFQKSSIFVIHANERLMKEIQTICN